MAPKRKLASKRATRSKTQESPKPHPVLRRSSRVRKRTTEQPRKASDVESLKAAHSLEGDAQWSKSKKPAKRVSFHEPQENAAPPPTPSINNTRNNSDYAQQQNNVTKPCLLLERKQCSTGALPSKTCATALSRAQNGKASPYKVDEAGNLDSPVKSAKLDQQTGTKRSLETCNQHHSNQPVQSNDSNMESQAKRQKQPPWNIFGPIYPKSNPEYELRLSQLGHYPHILTLKQISSILIVIQNRIMGHPEDPIPGFSEKYFKFTLTEAQIDAWPLHELQTKHPSLYMTTRYVADGSQLGWRNFFTCSQTRQHLVSAVLGEWFTQRIFKHTAFGFPVDLVNELEDIDREYLHYDAVVRSKERAKMMRSWYDDFKIWPIILKSTREAAESLAEELLEVLHPLLPPPIFDPLHPLSLSFATNGGRKDSITLRRERVAKDLRSNIKRDLIHLILDCTALHKSIRLTGANGTIVRWCPNPQKGSQYHQTAPTDCVNQAMCEKGFVEHDNSREWDILIKMTCWPRVEAIVPEGPDMAELAALEDQYRQDAAFAQPVKRCRGTHDDDLYADDNVNSDYDDSHDSDAFSVDSTSTASSAFTWTGKDHHWPVVPASLQDEEGRNPGVLNPETDELNTVKRAAYVKLYPALCPAKVFCEWTPLPISKGQSLPDAVTEARQSHVLVAQLKIEDYKILAWNAWAQYGGLAQWALLTAGTIIAIYKNFRIPNALRLSLSKMVLWAQKVYKSYTDGDASLITEMPSELLTEAKAALESSTDTTRPFLHALVQMLQRSVIEPLAAVGGMMSGGMDAVTRSSRSATGPQAIHQNLTGFSVDLESANALAENFALHQERSRIIEVLSALVASTCATGAVNPVFSANVQLASEEGGHQEAISLPPPVFIEPEVTVSSIPGGTVAVTSNTESHVSIPIDNFDAKLSTKSSGEVSVTEKNQEEPSTTGYDTADAEIEITEVWERTETGTKTVSQAVDDLEDDAIDQDTTIIDDGIHEDEMNGVESTSTPEVVLEEDHDALQEDGPSYTQKQGPQEEDSERMSDDGDVAAEPEPTRKTVGLISSLWRIVERRIRTI